MPHRLEGKPTAFHTEVFARLARARSAVSGVCPVLVAQRRGSLEARKSLACQVEIADVGGAALGGFSGDVKGFAIPIHLHQQIGELSDPCFSPWPCSSGQRPLWKATMRFATFNFTGMAREVPVMRF